MALTKYREGSVGELWSVSFPLMLSSFSIMMMLFVDRLLLAHYSTEALNAAVNAATLGWAFVLGWMVLTSISEVFVSQYNGGKNYGKLGEPAWQMIWIGFASIIFFIPMAYWGGELAYGQERPMEKQFFFWMMLFGPSFAVYNALAGFFVGQGKTRLITVVVCFANVVNALLDVVLIFGIEGWVPSYGIKGAAIATSCGGVFQMLVLGVIFFSKRNREEYGTDQWELKWGPLWDCLRVGVPGALFVSVEILGWAAYYDIMTKAGVDFITIAGICQSIILLFWFFAEGLSKGTTAVVGNLIGAGHHWKVSKVLWSGVVLNLLFFIFVGAFFALGSDFMIQLFLPNASQEKLAEMYQPLLLSLASILLYLLFEGFRFVLSGMLTAAGDTFFLLVAGTLSVWLCLVLPVYVAVMHWGAGVELASFICACYSALASLVYFWRFKAEKWKHKTITTFQG